MKKRILSLALVLTLVLCMSINAFATPNDAFPANSVHVVFTNNCTINYNFPEDPDTYYYEWALLGAPSEDEIALDAGYVVLNDSLIASRNYVPAGEYDPLPNEISVMDVILAQTAAMVSYNWDYAPVSGLPGAYVYGYTPSGATDPVEGYMIDFYEVDDGVYFISGYGIVVCIEDADGNFICPDSYLSSVPAEAGMTVYIDLGYYELYFR